jgi:Protein of unknown function (DUF3618)
MTQPEIQQEIEQTRERLGQTVEELAAKADVKARARAKAAELKAKAQDQAARLSREVSQSQTVQRDWPLALVAAGILTIGAALAWRRRTT